MDAFEVVILVIVFIAGIILGSFSATKSQTDDCIAFGKFRVSESVFICNREIKQ